VAKSITDGGYLLSPGWLADWRGHVADMGFPPEARVRFFKDFARRWCCSIPASMPASGAAPGRDEPCRRPAGDTHCVGLDHIRACCWRACRPRMAAG
jgi:hypothetical protein